MMDETRHMPSRPRRAPHGGRGFVAPLAAVLLLGLAATASAETSPGSFGVAKDRGFTLTPPFQRSKSYTMSCGYGCGAHDNIGTQDHFALDFLMNAGEPVHPAAPGTVRIAKSVLNTGNPGFEAYGRFVLIEHSNGYYSMYAHLDSVSVGVGAWVDVDAPIGTAGKTGSGSNGVNHLHFALYKGLTYINATDASYSGGSAVVPETLSGCTKSSGGDCEYLGNYHVLRRDDFAPEVIVRNNGVLDVFTCNRSQRNLMHRRRDLYGAWGAWTNLQGVCASSPTAVRDGLNNVFVFVRGLDAKVYYKVRSNAGGGWSGWSSIGDSVVGRPAAALDTVSGLIRVFVRRTPNQQVYLASQQSSGSSSFTGWQLLGGTLTNSPVAGTRADGRVDVYAAGLDYTLWKLPGNSDGTHTYEYWHPQYVAIEGEPNMVAHGTLEWVARSTGNQLLLLSNAISSATHRPAVARNANGSLYTFVRNSTDSAAHYLYPSGTGWGRSSFGGLVTSELESIRGTSNHLMMFTWGTGGLYLREQTAPDTSSWYDWYDLGIPP